MHDDARELGDFQRMSRERLGIAYRPIHDTLVEHAEQVLGSS